MATSDFSPKQSKSQLAKQLNISRSSLYYKPKIPRKDLELKTRIEKVLSNHKAYGHKRLAIELKINKKRVLRVMKLFKLRPERRRKKPKKTDDLNQAPMNIPNLIKELIVNRSNQVWASDFTYLSYFGRFVYLATLEDVFTRQIVGWAISTRHNKELVIEALNDALIKRNAPDIAHSDQGSEYRSQKYLGLLESLNISPSMSKKASPWENCFQESFYSGFKLELGHPEIYPAIGELIEAVALQINYYNNSRIHTALKCPPAVFAQRCLLNESYFINIRNNNGLLINQVPVVRQVV